MKVVYNLIMIDEGASYDDYIEAFNIGFFSDRDKAEKTAERYLKEVEGFKDHSIAYQIEKKFVIGCTDDLSAGIYIIYGRNENDELDEIDVIESDCYVNKSEAEEKLNELKASCFRKEWCIDRYIIDECHWQEGFVKL